MVSKYRLLLEVLEKVVEVNSPPYFSEWESYSIFQTSAFAGEVRASIPVPVDDDGDSIQIEFDFLQMASFSDWDQQNSEIVMFIDFAVEELQ